MICLVAAEQRPEVLRAPRGAELVRGRVVKDSFDVGDARRSEERMFCSNSVAPKHGEDWLGR